MPFCIKPERGQVAENVSKPSTKQSCDVFHNDKTGFQLANKTGVFTPEPRTFTVKSGAVSCEADILAGEASANNVNWSDIFAPELRYVFELADVRPVFRQHAPAEWVNLAEGDGFESARALKAKAEAANSAEQVKHAQRQFGHCFVTRAG